MTNEKINASEILEEKELDQIAGGFGADTYEDLAVLKEQCGLEIGGGDYEYTVRVLAENYASAGIRFRARNHHSNEYYDMRTGQQISHMEALSTLVEFGHQHGRYGGGYGGGKKRFY